MNGRRRRFGAIRRLPSGRWQVRYRADDGTLQPAPNTFTTKTDADRFRSRIETGMERGAWVDPRLGRATVGEWAEHYLGTAVHLKPKTRASFESLLRSAVLPRFESVPLASVQTGAVGSWVAQLSGRGLSPSRVRQSYNLLGAMMNAAVADGLIAVSPCRGIKLPRLPRPQLRYLLPEQVDALASSTPEPYGLLVEVLAYAGLRFGEAAALRRLHCDLARDRLMIGESATEVDGRLVFGRTKSHQERRAALPPSLSRELATHLAHAVSPDPQAFAITAPQGGPLRYGNFMRRVWRPAAERAGLDENVTPHLLRHTAATLLINEGASVKDVQAHLGHADAAVTLNVLQRRIRGPPRGPDAAPGERPQPGKRPRNDTG